jgi:hypothetical protein
MVCSEFLNLFRGNLAPANRYFRLINIRGFLRFGYRRAELKGEKAVAARISG